MKRMRYTLPSAESQKPSTAVRSVWPAFAKDPRTVTSVKGFGASGPATFAVTSTKSYASTLAPDCENVTSLGTPSIAVGSAKVNSNADPQLVRPNMSPLLVGYGRKVKPDKIAKSTSSTCSHQVAVCKSPLRWSRTG